MCFLPVDFITVASDCRGIELVTENQSTNATGYLWNFGDGTSSQEQHPVHYYSVLQSQTIQLIAFNGNCSDTLYVSGITFDLLHWTLFPM
ncbi:MAG: PKD domain-containing protein [Bacteroidetes bacterium]|nr:PKD domain-containing protein [Bacteroidota bacterium]